MTVCPPSSPQSPDVAIDPRLTEIFAALCIRWRHYEHSPVFTVADSHDLHARIPGRHTKNLFLTDANDGFFLVTTDADARIDLKDLPRVIGCKRLSFGKTEVLHQLLGVLPGAITPLAAINDVARRVRVVIDRSLSTADIVNVHPLRNTATLALAGSDLIGVLEHLGSVPTIVELPRQSTLQVGDLQAADIVSSHPV